MDKVVDDTIKQGITTDLSSVQIWDNLLDDRFLLDLDEESNLYNWNLNNGSNKNSFPYNKKGDHVFWGCHFTEKLPKNIKMLYDFIMKYVVEEPYKLNFTMVNGQSLGQHGKVHQDAVYNSGERTLMVFINLKWQKEWGGEFQLLDGKDNENSKIIKNIEYIPGRIIIFDGNIPHRGLAPTVPYVVRKSLVFRLSK